MTADPIDPIGISHRLQQTLRAAQAQLVGLRAHLAALNLPDPSAVTCPRCQTSFPGPKSLAEHWYLSHDGELPAHWAQAEAQAIDQAERRPAS